MKKLVLLAPILAAIMLFAKPVFADDAHHHEKDAYAAQEETAEPAEKMNDHESMMRESMKKMRAQMAKIEQIKDPKKRLKPLQEHNQNMRDNIKMMREMMGNMAMGCAMESGHKMGGNPVSQPDGKADAAPAAQASPDQITATDKTSANLEKKLWVCPMHPEVVRDQPGTCPICGMDLVEMEQPGTSQPEHSHTMSGCMKGDCMKGGGMMGGGMKCQMMEMTNKHMDMMLMLMEQMIEHDEAEMAVRK